MNKQLKLFFPKLNENEIKNEIKTFEKFYFKIIKEIKNNTENVLENKYNENEKLEELVKNENEKIIEKLNEYFPWYNEKLIIALKNTIDTTTNEEKLNDIINWLLNRKCKNTLIKPEYIKREWVAVEFLKTIKSMWIIDWNYNNSNELTNKYDIPKEKPNIWNYLENYKNWVWKKLLLSEKEIDLLTVDSLENRMIPYLELSINHIKKVIDWLTSEYKEDLKSIFFENIHSQEENISFFSLFKKYYELEKEKRKIIKDSGEKKYRDHLIQIKNWQYEIQRIVTLATLYINRENTLTFQNAKEEQNFLISKISEIWSDEFKNHYLESSIKNDNLLYNYTKKGELYWTVKVWKDGEENYIVWKEKIKWYNKTNIDTFEIEWKTRNYKTNTEKVEILHIWSRIRKDPFSSVEKMIRKWLSSFNEILDHKWFIFVIDKYWNDLERLKKILEYELWTLKTSWLEETESMKTNWNENTNNEYNSMKWILKVSYKWKLIKDFFELLWEILEKNKLKEIKKQFIELKKEKIDDIDINNFEELINNVNNENLYQIYNDLKERFWNKKYFMEVEIQIFDKENYIKAEIDKESPAYHWNYKKLQSIETLPIYFPEELYWETIYKILKDELVQTTKYKHLSN